MSFNCSSTKFGVIDVNGLLSIFAMDTESLDEPWKTLNPVLINHRNDAWDLRWSDDDPDLYAVMEKSRLYIFRGSSPEEPVCSHFIRSVAGLLFILHDIFRSSHKETFVASVISA